MTTNGNSNSSSGGIGIAGALFLVFLVLKLTHVIDWSWWWVTAPLWLPTIGVLVIAVTIFPFWLARQRKADRRRWS